MAQIDAQKLLDLCERTGELAFFDIEATGLKGDYDSILVASVKPFGGKVKTFCVKQPGDDKRLVVDFSNELEKYTIISGYYSKGYDIPMLRTRMLLHGMVDFLKPFHLDMYYSLKSNMLTSRRSQGHLLSLLGVPEQKMTVSASVWSNVAANPKKHLPVLVRRCESDVAGLEALYKKTRHLIKEVKR